ncbi:MAG: TonB-dependent receptor, partial [Pseudomonadota bacterium]
MTKNNIKRISKKAMLAGSSVLSLSLAGLTAPAFAQDDEIIVTAQKRAESIQDVPLAITAFGGEFVRDVNLDDVKDLVNFTPGVTGNTFDSFIDYINVRGISTNDFGAGGDPSVPFFKNGFYQGRNGAVVTTLYDIERAEVLRGPQGFLFGRNAIGGAINVITARPKLDAFGGYIDLDVGERDRLVGEIALNIPLTDKFAVRIAGYGGKEDGYVDNAFFPNADKLLG